MRSNMGDYDGFLKLPKKSPRYAKSSKNYPSGNYSSSSGRVLSRSNVPGPIRTSKRSAAASRSARQTPSSYKTSRYPMAAAARAGGTLPGVGSFHGPDRQLRVNQLFFNIVQECRTKYNSPERGFDGTPQQTQELREYLRRALAAIGLEHKLNAVMPTGSIHGTANGNPGVLFNPRFVNPAENAAEVMNDIHSNIGWNTIKNRLASTGKTFGSLRGGAAPKTSAQLPPNLSAEQADIEVPWSFIDDEWQRLRGDAQLGVINLPDNIDNLGVIKPLMYPGTDMGDSLRNTFSQGFAEVINAADPDYRALEAGTRVAIDRQELETRRNNAGNRIDLERLQLATFLSNIVDIRMQGRLRYKLPDRSADNEDFRDALTAAYAMRAYRIIHLAAVSLLHQQGNASVIDVLRSEIHFRTALRLHEQLWQEFDGFRLAEWLEGTVSADVTRRRIQLRIQLDNYWNQQTQVFEAAIRNIEAAGNTTKKSAAKGVVDGGQEGQSKKSGSKTQRYRPTGESEMVGVMTRMRQAYQRELDDLIAANDALDAGDPGDRQAIQMNNINIMSKNQVILSLDVEIQNLIDGSTGALGFGAKHGLTAPSADDYWRDTKRIRREGDLPTSIRTVARGPLPGEHMLPGIPRVIVGGPIDLGDELPDFSTAGPPIDFTTSSNVIDQTSAQPAPTKTGKTTQKQPKTGGSKESGANGKQPQPSQSHSSKGSGKIPKTPANKGGQYATPPDSGSKSSGKGTGSSSQPKGKGSQGGQDEEVWTLGQILASPRAYDRRVPRQTRDLANGSMQVWADIFSRAWEIRREELDGTAIALPTGWTIERFCREPFAAFVRTLQYDMGVSTTGSRSLLEARYYEALVVAQASFILENGLDWTEAVLLSGCAIVRFSEPPIDRDGRRPPIAKYLLAVANYLANLGPELEEPYGDPRTEYRQATETDPTQWTIEEITTIDFDEFVRTLPVLQQRDLGGALNLYNTTMGSLENVAAKLPKTPSSEPKQPKQPKQPKESKEPKETKQSKQPPLPTPEQTPAGRSTGGPSGTPKTSSKTSSKTSGGSKRPVGPSYQPKQPGWAHASNVSGPRQWTMQEIRDSTFEDYWNTLPVHEGIPQTVAYNDWLLLRDSCDKISNALSGSGSGGAPPPPDPPDDDGAAPPGTSQGPSGTGGSAPPPPLPKTSSSGSKTGSTKHQSAAPNTDGTHPQHWQWEQWESLGNDWDRYLNALQPWERNRLGYPQDAYRYWVQRAWNRWNRKNPGQPRPTIPSFDNFAKGPQVGPKTPHAPHGSIPKISKTPSGGTAGGSKVPPDNTSNKTTTSKGSSKSEHGKSSQTSEVDEFEDVMVELVEYLKRHKQNVDVLNSVKPQGAPKFKSRFDLDNIEEYVAKRALDALNNYEESSNINEDVELGSEAEEDIQMLVQLLTEHQTQVDLLNSMKPEGAPKFKSRFDLDNIEEYLRERFAEGLAEESDGEWETASEESTDSGSGHPVETTPDGPPQTSGPGPSKGSGTSAAPSHSQTPQGSIFYGKFPDASGITTNAPPSIWPKQPPSYSGLFGGNPPSTNPPGGGLFGGRYPQSTNQQGRGLFGGSYPQSTNPPGNGLFGGRGGSQPPGTGANTNQPQPGWGGTLWGTAPAGYGGSGGNAPSHQPSATSGTGVWNPTGNTGNTGGSGTTPAAPSHSQNPPYTGLFGSDPPSTNQPGSGLFGGKHPQSTNPQGGGLFGGSHPQSTNQQGSGLFGGKQPSTSSTGSSLFGGRGGSQPPGTGANTNPHQTAWGGSLWGKIPDGFGGSSSNAPTNAPTNTTAAPSNSQNPPGPSNTSGGSQPTTNVPSTTVPSSTGAGPGAPSGGYQSTFWNPGVAPAGGSGSEVPGSGVGYLSTFWNPGVTPGSSGGSGAPGPSGGHQSTFWNPEATPASASGPGPSGGYQSTFWDPEGTPASASGSVPSKIKHTKTGKSSTTGGPATGTKRPAPDDDDDVIEIKRPAPDAASVTKSSLQPLEGRDGWADLSYLIRAASTAQLAQQALGQRPAERMGYAVPPSTGRPQYPVPIWKQYRYIAPNEKIADL